MATGPHDRDFIVDMYHLEREKLPMKMSEYSNQGVGKVSRPNVTLAPLTNKGEISPADSHVTRSYAQGSEKHVGFKDERSGYVRDHSTPYRVVKPKHYSEVCTDTSQVNSHVGPLEWDDHGFDSRYPLQATPQRYPSESYHPSYFQPEQNYLNFQRSEKGHPTYREEHPTSQRPHHFFQENTFDPPLLNRRREHPTNQTSYYFSQPFQANKFKLPPPVLSNFEEHPTNQQSHHFVQPFQANTFKPPVSMLDNQPSCNSYHKTNYRKPPDYDGTSSFYEFLVQFELISEMSRWDRNTMTKELVSCLHGSAVTVLSELQPTERMNYHALVSALKARFEPDNQSQLYWAQLKSRIRGSNESLAELAQDIRKLTRMANPSANSELREILAKDSFMDSFNDREIELAVFQSQAKTLNGCLRVAVEFEAFRGSRQRKFPTTSIREQVATETQDVNQKLESICNRLEQLENQSVTKRKFQRKDKSTIKCFLCNKFGYYKSECPNNKEESGTEQLN